MPVTPPSDIAWADTAREHVFTHWLQAQAPLFQLQPDSLRMASADVCFILFFGV